MNLRDILFNSRSQILSTSSSLTPGAAQYHPALEQDVIQTIKDKVFHRRKPDALAEVGNQEMDESSIQYREELNTVPDEMTKVNHHLERLRCH